jgi:hypothetical protein
MLVNIKILDYLWQYTITFIKIKNIYNIKTDKQILVWVIYLFSHALSIYTVYVFNFENVVISHV